MIRFSEREINDILVMHMFANELKTTFETKIDLIDFNCYFQRMFLTKISSEIKDYDIKTIEENQKNIVKMQRIEEVNYDLKNILNARHKKFYIKYSISRETIFQLSKNTQEDFLKNCKDKTAEYLDIEMVKEILEINKIKEEKTIYYEIPKEKAINEMYFELFNIHPELKSEEHYKKVKQNA